MSDPALAPAPFSADELLLAELALAARNGFVTHQLRGRLVPIQAEAIASGWLAPHPTRQIYLMITRGGRTELRRRLAALRPGGDDVIPQSRGIRVLNSPARP